MTTVVEELKEYTCLSMAGVYGLGSKCCVLARVND